MAQVNSDLAVLDGLVKKVYGKGVHQAVPDNVKWLFDLIPFTPNGEMLGDKFVEAINLSVEQGVTFGTGTAGVVTLNPAQSGKVKQALVDASFISIQAEISWDLVAKASGSNTAQSFEKGVTSVVDNALISHRRWQAVQMLYGTDNVGVVTPGATSATQTITNASCAAGIFYGSDNAFFDIYDPTLTTKRNGSPLQLISYAVDSTGASRTVTFGASVATTTLDVIVPTGWVVSTAYQHGAGLSTIAGQTGGTLFGLSQTTYPMFAGVPYAVGGVALTLATLDKAATLPFTRGYSGKMTLLCNPRTFSNLCLEETARVQFTQNRVTGTAEVGFDELRITTSTGINLDARMSPFIKEGEAYIVPRDGTLKRIGACDIKLGGPMQEPAWQRVPLGTGYYLPTYSLSGVFTPEPWKLVKLTGIVNT